LLPLNAKAIIKQEFKGLVATIAIPFPNSATA